MGKDDIGAILCVVLTAAVLGMLYFAKIDSSKLKEEVGGRLTSWPLSDRMEGEGR